MDLEPSRGALPNRSEQEKLGRPADIPCPPLLRPLPAEQFETGLSLAPLVDRYARITVRQSTYSVPARFGRRIRVLLTADEVTAFDRRIERARYERSTVKGSTTVVLDHYLEILRRKPGALAGATALAQARAARAST